MIEKPTVSFNTKKFNEAMSALARDLNGSLIFTGFDRLLRESMVELDPESPVVVSKVTPE